MPKTVVYPVEPGFVWLLNQDGRWGGWSQVPTRDGDLREVAIAEVEGEVYYIYFCYANGWSAKVKWADRLNLSGAQHYNMWRGGLPEKEMDPVELQCLQILLDLELGLEPNGTTHKKESP